LSVVLADGSNPVDDNSVALQVDGQPAPFTKQRVGNVLSINASPAAVLQLAGEAHGGLLTFKDSTGTYSRTQQWTFYNLENLILPATQSRVKISIPSRKQQVLRRRCLQGGRYQLHLAGIGCVWFRRQWG
jgi:hypothetical protein